MTLEKFLVLQALQTKRQYYGLYLQVSAAEPLPVIVEASMELL